MAIEIKRAVDYYINSSSKIPNRRKRFVREKLLASEWISCEEQNPPSRTKILAKYKNGSVYVGLFYGFHGDGVLKVTHWKPLIK